MTAMAQETLHLLMIKTVVGASVEFESWWINNGIKNRI